MGDDKATTRKRARRKKKTEELKAVIDASGLESQVIETYTRWRLNPYDYVRECIGVCSKTRPSLCITTQQEDGLRKIGELVSGKIRVNGGVEGATDKDREMAQKIGLSIMSGHGTGKDAFTAWVIQWFMDCFPWVRGLATAPTAPALKNVLFSEVTKWLNLKNTEGNFVNLARDRFEVQQMKILRTDVDKMRLGKGWFIEGRTAGRHMNSEEQGETLAGVHEDYMVMIADEASGISDPVFLPMEGSLTGLCNWGLIIFNPTKRGGYAYQTHRGNARENWERLHWDAEDSEIVSEQQIAMMKKKYGEQSNTYRIRVKGLPPLSDTNTLIPYDWVEECQRPGIEPDPLDPVVIGVDPALGGDEAIVMVRKGMVVTSINVCPHTGDTDEIGHYALSVFYDQEGVGGREGADVLYVDRNGLGEGVYSYLKRFIPNRLVCVNVSESAAREDKFYRLRDELWWKARQLFEKRIPSLPDDEIMIAQFSDPRIDNDPYFSGKIKVESKRKMKARHKGSPDRAESFIITLFRDDKYYRKAKEGRMDKWKRRFERQKRKDGKSWMAQ